MLLKKYTTTSTIINNDINTFGHPPDKSLFLKLPIKNLDINSITGYVCLGTNSDKLKFAFPAIRENNDGNKTTIEVPTAKNTYLKK